MKTKRIAIIPARGGSKRLPRKNILPFNGRPMIAWTIEAALGSGLFDRVLVSTDDEEIKHVSISAGAEVPFMRQAAFDDHAPSSEATLSSLIQAEKHWAETYDTVTQLMANCPLRSSEDVKAATLRFEGSGVPAQISCFKFGWMNPWWALQLSPEGRPTYAFPEIYQSRSQDLPPLYCPTGAIWIADRQNFEKHKSFYVPGHVFHPMNYISAVDIDDEEDLVMAQVFAAFRQNHMETHGR